MCKTKYQKNINKHIQTIENQFFWVFHWICPIQNHPHRLKRQLAWPLCRTPLPGCRCQSWECAWNHLMDQHHQAPGFKVGFFQKNMICFRDKFVSLENHFSGWRFSGIQFVINSSTELKLIWGIGQLSCRFKTSTAFRHLVKGRGKNSLVFFFHIDDQNLTVIVLRCSMVRGSPILGAQDMTHPYLQEDTNRKSDTWQSKRPNSWSCESQKRVCIEEFPKALCVETILFWYLWATRT